MTWSDLLPLLAQGGVVSVLAWIAYRLHVDSVHTHEARALDAREDAKTWREAYFAEAARNRELAGQVGTVVRAVERAVTP